MTEIAIFKTDGIQILEQYHTLINPQADIPRFITGLTGIDNAMVAMAPTFKEVAPKIYSFLEDCIFVAHSVQFDYGVIKREYERIGISFTAKKLCTVRLSRKLFTGLPSYSLGQLCHALNIHLKNRHRAFGDAEATLELFQRIYQSEAGKSEITKALHARSREATLPPLLPKDVLKSLPATPGIYFFWNQKKELLYVGKAIDLKKRIWGHFYDKSDKETRLCQNIADITFEETGSELLALLLETAAIKKYWPPYNQAQKSRNKCFGIYHYQDGKGIRRLGYGPSQINSPAVLLFSTITECRTFLEELAQAFDLCPKRCQLKNTCCLPEQGCSSQTSTIEGYNEKVDNALQTLKTHGVRELILLEGRNEGERGFVVLEDGKFWGYGFMRKEINVSYWDEIEPFVTRQMNYQESQQIIRSYKTKYPTRIKVVKLSIS